MCYKKGNETLIAPSADLPPDNDDANVYRSSPFGLALYGLALGFILWLNLLAFAPSYFDLAQTYLSSTEGQVALFISLWIFCHHLCGGLRHFIWDLGLGLGHYGREIFAFGTFIFGLLLAVGIFLAPNYEIILQELNR